MAIAISAMRLASLPATTNLAFGFHKAQVKIGPKWVRVGVTVNFRVRARVKVSFRLLLGSV